MLRLLLLGPLFVMTAVVSSVAGEDSPPTTVELVAAWKAYEAKTPSLKAIWNSEVASSKHKTVMQLYLSDVGTWRFQRTYGESPGYILATWKGNRRVYYEHPAALGGDRFPRVLIQAFSFEPHSYLAPVAWTVRPTLLAADPTAITLVGPHPDIDGQACYCYSIRDKKVKDRVNDVYVTAEAPHLPIRVKQRFKAKVNQQFDLQHETKDDVVKLKSWRRQCFSPGSPFVTECEVTDFTIGGVTADEVTFNIPEGTFIIDRIANPDVRQPPAR